MLVYQRVSSQKSLKKIPSSVTENDPSRHSRRGGCELPLGLPGAPGGAGETPHGRGKTRFPMVLDDDFLGKTMPGWWFGTMEFYGLMVMNGE